MKTTFVNKFNFNLISKAILFAFASCKDDDPVDKSVDYAGVWVMEKKLR